MAFTSSDISGMVGGQMAMFSNQATFSQQIGGMMGGGMGAAGGGMQNPFPENMGSRMAGGLGMALPGIATGASLAGGMMGGTMGWLDPFTAAGRGFASGAGISGGGMGATMGHLGRTFATGGMRAGLGAMGGGMLAGAAAAAPIAAIGAGVQFMGENIHAGAQNYAQVGAMANQYMGPQWGQAGSRPGGQLGRETVRGMVGALHELVGEDGIATMKELKGLMDTAGRLGMLTGIGDVNSFKNKMKDMVRQVKALADVMGTTIEAAGPMLGQMRQMGLWKTSDILGAAVSARVAGPQGAPAMVETMQTGAQMSHALGGTRRAGAQMGRQMFETLQAAVRSGVMSNEQVEEFTGGLGGAEGQAAMGQKLMGYMAQFGQTDAGRAMKAALGEMKGGQFTGEVDREKLNRFLQGGISTNELMQEGYARTRTRGAKMSYLRMSEKMNMNLAAAGGPEVLTQMAQNIANEKFGGDEQARHQLLVQMYGMSNADAEAYGQLANGMGKIRDKALRDVEAATKRIFDETERKNLRSMEALKRSTEIMFEQAKRPFQEIGEKLSASYSEMVDSLSERLMGYTKAIPMDAQEKTRLLREGAFTKSTAGMAGLGAPSAAEWARSSPMANLNLAMREQGSLAKGGGGAAAGMMAGSIFGLPGMLIGAGIGAYEGLMAGGAPRERYLQNIGVSIQASGQDLEKGIASAVKRAESPTRKALGITDESKLGQIKGRLMTIVGNESAELAQMKKDNPQGYTRELLKKLEASSPTMFQGMSDQEKLNYLAVAQAEEGLSTGLAADFKEDVAKVGYVNTAEGARKKQAEIISSLSEITGAKKEQLERAMTSGPGSDIMAKFVSGGMTRKEAIVALSKVEGADETRKILEGLSEEKVAQFKQEGTRFIGYRGAELQLESYKTLQSIAARSTANIKGLTQGTKEQLGKLLETYKGGEDKEISTEEYKDIQAQTEALAKRKLTADELKALQTGGGAIGRQIVGLQRAFGLGGGRMGKEQVGKLFEEFKGLGFDIEQLGGAEMKKALESGVKASDAEKFKKDLIDIMKNTLTDTKEARQSVVDEYNSRIAYISANERFVGAVNKALGDHDISVQDAAAELKKGGQGQSPQAAAGETKGP